MSAHQNRPSQGTPPSAASQPRASSGTVTETLRAHGAHPVGVAAYILLIIGFGSLGVWVATLASGATAWAIGFGILALFAFVVSITVLIVMTRRLHHSAVLPDPTVAEEQEYLQDHRRRA